MGEEQYIFNILHKKSTRDCIGRMNDDKVKCMDIAQKFGEDFWDGDRKYGYGGYKYIPGWWEPVAKKLIKQYRLTNDSSILDVGCGKAFLLYEIKKILPNIKIKGFDISKYAIKNAKEEVRDLLFVHKAQEKYPFKDKEFDLVISFTTLHNLEIFDLKKALIEIERVGKNKFLVVESFRNNQELFNVQCWALTCKSFFTPEAWIWLFNEYGYTGDYEFIFFE